MIKKPRPTDRIASVPVRMSLCCLLAVVSASAASAQEAPGPATGLLELELPAVTTQIGATFEVRLQAHTTQPLRVIALRVEALPSQIRLRQWTFGEGLANHIALHGEPPACDIIVYPDGSRMFAIMVMDPPFSSAVHGSDWLHLEFAVEARNPGSTCILHTGDTPDYEPGDDLISTLSKMRPERRCAPVFIRQGPSLLRGDADGDGRQSLGDAVRLLRYLFWEPRPLVCADAADWNDDGLLNVSDSILLLHALFLGDEPQKWSCAADSTPDTLPDCERPSC